MAETRLTAEVLTALQSRDQCIAELKEAVHVLAAAVLEIAGKAVVEDCERWYEEDDKYIPGVRLSHGAALAALAKENSVG